MSKKNIFDDIRATNIIDGKRNQTRESEQRQNDDSTHNDSSDDDEPSGSGTELVPSILEKFSENMLNGFEKMNESFKKFGENLVERIGEKMDQFFDYEECNSEEDTADSETEVNIFSSLAEDENSRKLGPEVNSQLGEMMNQLLKTEMSSELTKEKEAKYLTPKNVEVASAPRVNPPVWDVMGNFTRKDDMNLQKIQRNVLKSSIPVAKVMEELYKNKDNPDQIDVNQLITTLSDSINFIGSANVQLVRARKNFLRKDLPKNMRGLCSDTKDFSSEWVFGDDLKGKIKEVSELNQIKHKFTSDSSRGGKRGSFRGRFNNSRGHRSRDTRKYTPYKSTAKEPKNGQGSKSGPSKKA